MSILRIGKPRVSMLFLCGFMLISLLLTACGGSSPSTTTTSSSPVTLTFGWWSNGPDKDAKFKTWVESYTKTHPNVTIHSEFLPWGDYWSKLKTSVAAGTAYDLIGSSSGPIAPFYANDQLVDLSTFSDYQSTIANLAPGSLAVTSFDNKKYSLPIGLPARVIGYNKAMFATAGVAAPDPVKPLTLTQFMALAKKLSIVQNGKLVQSGFNSGLEYLPDYVPGYFIENQNASFFDSMVNPKKVTVNTPAGIKGLTDFQSLFTNKITPSPDDDSWKNGLEGLQSGRVAMTITGPWEFAQTDTAKYGVMPFPISDDGRHLQRMGINSMSIFKGSKHPQEAWDFLKWTVQTEQQKSFSTFSDVPVEKNAFADFKTVIVPASFYPTLQVEATNVQPSLLTPNTEVGTIIGDILKDLARGKLTPTQAAAQLDQQGNTSLSNG